MNPETLPTVGMGATFGIGSDAYPYTVVEVISPREVVVTADSYQNECTYPDQRYKFTTNLDGQRKTLTFRWNGKWWPKDRLYTRQAGTWSVGERRCYSDPSF